MSRVQETAAANEIYGDQCDQIAKQRTHNTANTDTHFTIWLS